MSAAAPGPDAKAGPPAPDLTRVDEIERASITGWPPSALTELADGWILRATPGLARGRSCHALTPRTRPLAAGELGPALERVREFSARHGIRGGLQVSPLELHAGIVPGLAAAGWQPTGPVLVMTLAREATLDRDRVGLARGSRPVGEGAGGWVAHSAPDSAWLAAWQAADPGVSADTVKAHVASVFAGMGTRAVFGRIGQLASGIAVEDPDQRWAGLFSLVVGEDHRGRGLGRALVLGLLGAVRAPGVYLQVMADNAPALRLYESLGFTVSHSYQHVLAPEGWAAALRRPAEPV